MMNRLIRKLPVALAAAALLAALLAASAAAKPPTVEKEESNLSSVHKVLLHAELNTYGHRTTWIFEWGVNGYEYETEPKTIEAGHEKPDYIYAYISDLTPGTTYKWRVLALNMDEIGPNGEGALTGKENTFKAKGLYMTDSGGEPRLASTESWGPGTEFPTRVAPGSTFYPVFGTSEEPVVIGCGSSSLMSSLGAGKTDWLGWFGGTFSECDEGSSANVSMNGCYYKTVVTSSGTPYTGDIKAIECPTSKPIELDIPGICILTVAEQTISSSSVKYDDNHVHNGTGAVNMEMEASGLTFNKVGGSGHFFCFSITDKTVDMQGTLQVSLD